MAEPPELEAQLRDHGEWTDRAFVPFDPASVRQQADDADGAPVTDARPVAPEAGAHGTSRSRRRPLLVAAAVLVVLGLVGVLALVTRDGDDGEQRLDVVDEPSTGSWSPVADFPFSDAQGTETTPVWTGDEVLLVGALVAQPGIEGGGLLTMATIPAFRPSTGEWRSLPPTPVPVVANGAEAVWTGDELVILYVPADASGPETAALGVAYDPGTDSWRTIAPAPPGRGVGGVAAWADGRILTWALGAGVTAYTPATDSWELLTVEPVAAPGSRLINSASASAVWTGEELVIADTDSPRVAAFDPTLNAWWSLPDRAATSMGIPTLAWTGTVLGIGDVRSPTWMAPDGTSWEQPSAPTPRDGVNTPGAQVWVGDRFLTWGGPGYGPPGSQPQLTDGLAVDLVTGDWSTIPAPPAGDPVFSRAVVAGDRLFTWGVDNDHQNLVGHGTIRAAISSPGFAASASLEPVQPPTTDPAWSDFCASFESWFEWAAGADPAMTADEQRVFMLEAVERFEGLVATSPSEIRGSMEVLAADLRNDPGAGPSSVDQEAEAAVDGWLDQHCGFTLESMGEASRASTPSTGPSSGQPSETAPTVVETVVVPTTGGP